MRKRIFGRRLKRDTNERKALFRSLMHGMILHGRITTTEAKAKSIQGALEKMVTLVRSGEEAAKSLALSRLANEKVVEKLVSEIAPKFVSRPGGYTRILKVGPRVKDGAKMVLMTWVEEVSRTSFKEPKRNAGKKIKSSPKIAEKKEKTKKSSTKAKK